MNTPTHGSRWPLILIFFVIFAFLGSHQAKAQYFAFGKNRVQYKNFDWRYIQSKHFDVYYYSTRNYMLASFTAIAEEASLQQLEEYFGHKINDRIEAIIYDSHNDFAETNVVNLPTNTEGLGGVTDPYKNRVTLPFEGGYDQFRQVLQHELVHAVINDMFYGGNVQSRISGNALEIPLWFNEGMAEYASKGFDTETDMWIRDASINDYLPPISQLGGDFFTAYRCGESIWNYIVQEYGRNKITEIFQELKNLRNVEAAFKRSLGLSLKEFSKRWHDYYRKRYLPEVAKREDLDDFGDLLTERGKTGTYNTSPAFSPQGDKIAIITNNGNAFDVVVINAITGKRIKTLIKGSGNVNFEELNILNPNLSWSPDGTKIALSATSEGQDHLAIVDYETGKKNFIAFPNIDAIGSVAWSPDGQKIAFDGNIGPYQDIFVYNLNTHKLINVTSDAPSDTEPVWASDSQTIYFTSARGGQLQLGQLKNNTELLATSGMYSTDIYSVKLGENRVQRLTKTPIWNEYQPETTRDGRLIFISDENGIPNIYQLNVADRTTTPLTNLQTGAEQISLSADGSRLAISSIHEGYLDIFTVSAPFSRTKSKRLSDDQWAQRRANEPVGKRVPAVDYVKKMAESKKFVSVQPRAAKNPFATAQNDTSSITHQDSAGSAIAQVQPDTTKQDTTKAEKHDNSNINFRNYVFEPEVEQDTVFANKYLDEDVFDVKGNTTDDDRYIPKDYRLKFSTDFISAGGGFSTYYGSNGVVQVLFSDLLGDHKIGFGSDLQFDLRNSSYFVQYGNFKHRVNWLYSLSHTAYNYLTYSNESLRYRYTTGGVTIQYPFNKFKRLDLTLSGVSIAQDYTIIGIDSVDNESSSFFYPRLTYTNDKTAPGYITPAGGFRYALEVSGSPPISNKTLQFASVLGDFRKYIDLGSRYSFAVRGSAGASFGRDAQTYFLGGMQGWINRKYSDATIPIDRFGSSFIAQPAIPLRGYKYFAITGDKFALANAEFRFPIFAAILPGPIPILPLYNLTGVAFVDAGMAWGQNIKYNLPGSNQAYYENGSDLDFKIRKDATVTKTYQDPNGNQQQTDLPAPEGDILIGAGFGLRTIVFGLPLRYDIGWPYYRDGFDGKPVNYISIGIDF